MAVDDAVDHTPPMSAETVYQYEPVGSDADVHDVPVTPVATVAKPAVADVVDTEIVYDVARATAIQVTLTVGAKRLGHDATTEPGGVSATAAVWPDEAEDAFTTQLVAAPATPRSTAVRSDAVRATPVHHLSIGVALTTALVAGGERQLVQPLVAGLVVTVAAPPVAVTPVKAGIEK